MFMTTTQEPPPTPLAAPSPAAQTRAGRSRVHLLEQILELNPSASMEFLGRFSDHALADYRDHLTAVQSPRGRNAVWVRPAHLPAIVVRVDEE